MGRCAHHRIQELAGEELRPIANYKPRGFHKDHPVCAFDGCARTAYAKGLCPGHYTMQRTGVPLRTIANQTPRGHWVGTPCSYPGCTDEAECAALCSPHYKRATRLQSEYGLSLSDWLVMFDEQDGRCAICGATDPGVQGFHVDHDHKTGEIRELLCNGCNLGIGKFHDDPGTLRAAAEYLEKHSAPRLAVCK
jgi:hypothetical protein